MCWTGPFEFRWLKGYIYNPSYYHHQIGSIHLSHCCHIFPWLRFWDGCTTILCHLLYIYIYISGTLGLCFNYLCSVYWCSVYGLCKRSDTLWPAGRVRLFADYTISLSSLCRLIGRQWTSKMLQVYAAECASKTILAIIFHSIYETVCLQLTQFACHDFENVNFILLS